MLTQEAIVEIHVLKKQGKGVRAIARELGVSRNTVRRYLRGSIALPNDQKAKQQDSKLDWFKPYLHERIAAAKPHWIPASVLFREIKAQGYQGKEGILRLYVRQFKPQSKDEPVVRFETPPGEQMQVDFTTITRGPHKLKAFVATLGYSRATFVRFSDNEQQEAWLTGIREALQYFGGVPRHLLFDNAKCIMIERDAYGQGKHRWNPQLLALSRDYGFSLRACQPYRAKTKGKVERFNGYLKNSFITPLAATLKQLGLVLDVDTANGQIGPWLAEVAHQRIHGTTGQTPQFLWDEERLSLQALPMSEAVVQVVTTATQPLPIESLQHPLSVYDQVLGVA